MLFSLPDITDVELAVIAKVDEARGVLRHVVAQPRRWTGLLRKTALARAIRASNSIEGLDVGRDDAIAAVKGDEPMDASGSAWLATVGYRRAMTYVLQLAEDPHFEYGPNIIRSLHFMMTEHDLSVRPGQWRPGPVSVRDDRIDEVVYEGPAADRVPALMHQLVDWIENDDRGSHPVLRAAMGHLNLVMIHPFKDGNGRMGRCLQTLMLAREGILAPEFCSIEEYLRDHVDEYYAVLKEAGRGHWSPPGNTLPWVRFTLTAHYRQAKDLLARHQQIESLFAAIEEVVANLGLPGRSTLSLAMAGQGFRIRNSDYREDADVSNRVATRDLRQLSEAGLLVPRGEKRGRYYEASDLLRGIASEFRIRRTTEDPFQSS